MNQAFTSAFVDELEKLSNAAGGGYFGSAGFNKGGVTAQSGRMASYGKGGPVKKDGYLTDKKGRPYARVHKGERVLPPLKDKLR